MTNLPCGKPRFIEHASRRIFVLGFHPGPEIDCKGAILHLPAFGEEMNKSRAMVVKQARAFTKQGYRVLVPDYYGTGDSEGDFRETSWELWLEDIQCCIRWLKQEPVGTLILWGLRLGALMALQLAENRELGISRLVLWNPVVLGEQYMQQFLRLRLANSMMSENGKEKISDLKMVLQTEGALEIAGYELPKVLFDEVCTLKAEEMEVPAVKSIFWVELSPSAKPVNVPSRRLIEHWKDDGVVVDVEELAGSQFWSTQEISESCELIESTKSWLGRVHSSSILTHK